MEAVGLRDIRALWAANSRFQAERTGDGEKP
jgi:hypothetical protein